MGVLEQLLAWKSLIIGSWLALFFILERFFPAAPWKVNSPDSQFSQSRHLAQNASFWLVNALLSPLLVISITAFAVNHSLALRELWLPNAPFLMWIIFDLVILDLWIYAWHRMNHQIPFLWRFHRVHHLDQQLDATSAFRFHFGEVIFSAILRMPVILIFAVPLVSVFIFEILVAIVAIFHHANLRIPPALEKRLSLLIITPSIHWVHHHAIRPDTDSNYGTILSCWDRLFRSMSPNRRSSTMVLGVEGLVENRIDRLFTLPFRSGG